MYVWSPYCYIFYIKSFTLSKSFIFISSLIQSLLYTVSLHCCLFLILNVVFKSRTLSKCSSFIRLKINKSTCHRINLVDHVSNQTILYFWKSDACLPNSTINNSLSKGIIRGFAIKYLIAFLVLNFILLVF